MTQFTIIHPAFWEARVALERAGFEFHPYISSANGAEGFHIYHRDVQIGHAVSERTGWAITRLGTGEPRAWGAAVARFLADYDYAVRALKKVYAQVEHGEPGL